MDVTGNNSPKHSQPENEYKYATLAPPDTFRLSATAKEFSTTNPSASNPDNHPISTLYTDKHLLHNTSLKQHHIDIMRQPDWDEKTVFIGKKATSKSTRPKPSAKPKPSQPTIIDVYIGDIFVAAVPKKLLKRFSGVANDVYGPQGSTTADGDGGAAGLVSEFPGMAKLTDAPNARSSARISFSLIDVQVQPSRSAVQSCIDWMNKHAEFSGEDVLGPLFVNDPADTPLTSLMDLYAAATCLALRPIGHDLRDEVLNRVNQTISEVAMMRHVHERFRPGTYVHEQTVKVYLNCVEQNLLSEEEFQEIDDFIASDDALAAAVQEGKERRARYFAKIERERKAAERVAASQQLRSNGFGGAQGKGSGQGQVANALPGNKKGVFGRHVPGA